MKQPIIINEITQEQLDTFARLDKNCIDMHLPPPPKLFTHIQVHDAVGDLEMDYKFKNNSWVRNAYNFNFQTWTDCLGNQGGTTYGPGKMPMRSYEGTDRPSSAYRCHYYLNNNYTGTAGSELQGIVIGTGTAAESSEDYKLDVRILHGTSSGKMAYQAMSTYPSYTYDAGTKKWTATYTRIFNNNSGASITVNEVGLQGMFAAYYSGNYWPNYSLVCRDKLSSGVVVASGSQLTVNISIEIVFPA